MPFTNASPLTITRGRTWSIAQRVMDSVNGPASNLTGYTNFRQQIRTFTGELVATVSVVYYAPSLTSSLTREQTEAIPAGDYETDIIVTDPYDKDEVLMEVESIRVVIAPTSPV